MASSEELLSLRSCSKTFDGSRVLSEVSLSIRRGEVHGLVGQNGSGKSTLIKILAGFHAPDPGAQLTINGRDIPLPMAEDVQLELGLSFVHQDLALFDGASVLENVFLEGMKTGFGRRIRWASERRRVATLFAEVNLEVDLNSLVGGLSPADKASVAIVRALARLRQGGGTVLVLDEPTPHLARDGVERLFRTVREVAARGLGVLIVTHRMDEILEITDRVTILRDGQLIGTVNTSEVDEAALSELLLGFHLPPMEVTGRAKDERLPLLSARGLSGSTVRNLDLDAFPGEVLGLTGLIGAGWEEFGELVFGASRGREGTITVRNESFRAAKATPVEAMAKGIAYVPGDRPRYGAAMTARVWENLTLPVLDRYVARGALRSSRERTGVRALLQEFRVRPPNPDAVFQSLSGGNQQKAIMAKWIQTQPLVLLLYEPTQGVDVAARQEIYARLRAFAEEGAAVVVASSEYDDLEQVCDRLLVFQDGRVVGELAGEQLTVERVWALSTTTMPKVRIGIDSEVEAE